MKNQLAAILLLISVSAKAQTGIGTTSPNSTLDIRGALSLNLRVFTGTTTPISNTDNTVVFTGTAATTATLPDATTCTGRIYRIQNASTTSPIPVLTLATTSAQTINGAGSWVLDEGYESVTIISNGTNWLISSQSVPKNTGSDWNEGGNTVSAIKNIGTISNYDLPFITNNTEKMRLSATGNMAVGISTFDGTNPEKLLVDAGTTSSFNVICGKGTINSYLQLNIQNRSTGAAASSDVVATADNGNESVNFIDMGMNSSGYATGASILNGINNAYLYSTGNDFIFGNATSGKNLLLFTGGTAPANERLRITGTGLVGIGDITPNSTLDVNGSLGLPITTTTTNITLDATNYTVILTGGTPTVTLPAAAGNARRIYIIVNQTPGPRTVSSYTFFDGNPKANIAMKASVTLQSDGTSWYQVQ